jgi:hypothetical protein
LFLLLGVLGVLALLLGLLLVYNTMNALIARQVDQIGVLKAVGARTGRILLLFSITVLIWRDSHAAGGPLGMLGGWAIASWLVSSWRRPGFVFVFVECDPWLWWRSRCWPRYWLPCCRSYPERITVREAVSTWAGDQTGVDRAGGSRLRFVSHAAFDDQQHLPQQVAG